MKKFRHILVGVDFSSASRAAINEAVRLASGDGATVNVVHIIEVEAAEQLRKAHNFDDAHLCSQVMMRLDHFLKESGAETTQVKAEVVVGHPYLSLVAACTQHSIDLLVLGSHGERHKMNQVGVIASKCVRKAPCDVLLVKENATGPYKQVLACVDMSETSAKAVQYARHVAEQDGAKLDCLYVYPSPMALAVDYGGLIPSASVFDKGLDEASRAELERFVAPLLRTDAKLEVRNVVIEHLNVRDAIVSHINESKAGLVVLGTRGKNDLRTLLMGTTAERVVADAPCSILTVKPDGFQYPVA